MLQEVYALAGRSDGWNIRPRSPVSRSRVNANGRSDNGASAARIGLSA